MYSATTRPSTASPRNSSRSFGSSPGCSAHQLRWRTARPSSSGSANSWPTRSPSAVMGSTGSSGSGADAAEDVVDGIAHRLQVLEVLVVDAEPHGALTDLLLERLDQLDEGERVGFEVVGERVTLVDRRRLDFEDVGEAVTDELEDLLPAHRS